MDEVVIRPAEGTGDIAVARQLFADYAGWLDREHGISLEFQGIAEELATLPGKYAPPGGVLLLGLAGERPVGCVAVRPFGAMAEIKRLYVRPEMRGQRLGHRLGAAALGAARELGYRRAVLDTGGFMAEAQSIYTSLGFRDIPAYYDNPYEGVRFMGCDLEAVNGV